MESYLLTAAVAVTSIKQLCYLLFRQYFYTLFFYKYHVLYLGRQSIIICIYGPAVILIYIELRCSLVDHRLDCEHHTRNKHHFTAFWCYITYKWLFVEFKTNSMSSNFLYNRISIFFCMRVDRVCNISQMPPWLCCL